MRRTGIRAKLVRAFVIQVAIISLGTVIGIYVTNSIINGVVMREALNAEAEHFWSRYEVDPTHPVPDVYNLRGYMARAGDLSTVPVELRQLQPVGFARVGEDAAQTLVHVSQRHENRLFLVFEHEQVSELAFYFGIIPLAVVLLLIYGLSFVTYRLSQQAVSPVVKLAKYLDDFDFNTSTSLSLDFGALRSTADAEVTSMIEAMDHFTTRLNAFIDRERMFARDAGHELRTPVAVFKGNLDLLEEDENRPAHEVKALKRMRRTVEDMESLLETLLLLAREEQSGVPKQQISVNSVVASQIDLLQPMADKANNAISVHEHADLQVLAPANVAEIVLGNLIRNAINYTHNGTIDVTVLADSVRVGDTGVGMSSEQLDNAFEAFYRADESRGVTRGHGLGLAIVKRLVHQAGWSISAHSKPGEGTTVELRFGEQPTVAGLGR